MIFNNNKEILKYDVKQNKKRKRKLLGNKKKMVNKNNRNDNLNYFNKYKCDCKNRIQIDYNVYECVNCKKVFIEND